MARAVIEFQDEDKRESLLSLADTKPSLLLNGEKPILFDEWQDAPKLWGAIRKYVDDSRIKDQFILTGSSASKITTPHIGTLRISHFKVFSCDQNGNVSYYHDRYGLEADAVFHLADGRYALIEIKLGQKEVDQGIAHLNKMHELIKASIKNNDQAPLTEPILRIVITATQYGYRDPSGVLVIPIGCLKN